MRHTEPGTTAPISSNWLKVIIGSPMRAAALS